MRHVALRHFVLSGLVRDGRLCLCSVIGERNPADMMTKALPADALRRHAASLNLFFGDAPQRAERRRTTTKRRTLEVHEA